MKKRKIRRVETALHFVTVIVLLLKATDLLKKHLFFPAVIILMAAITALAILFFRRRLHIRARHAGIICFYIETPALFIIGYVLHLEGKELLPYLFLSAGFIYPVAGFVATKKFKQIKSPR